jgi:hypothetical protein
VSFEEQWASVRAKSTTGPETSQNTRTALASADESRGQEGGRLVYLRSPWTNGAGILGELRTATNTSVTQVAEGRQGKSAGSDGLASALALDAVRETWHRRLKAVRDECDSLEGPMRQAAKDHGENEARIKAAMAAESTTAKHFPSGGR